MRLVLCYGIFDRPLNEYQAYFEAARLQGDRVLVVVVRDRLVLEALEQLPTIGEAARVERLRNHPLIESAYLAHPVEPWRTIEDLRPHICLLGEERHGLPEALEPLLICRGIFLSVQSVAHSR